MQMNMSERSYNEDMIDHRSYPPAHIGWDASPAQDYSLAGVLTEKKNINNL